MASSRDAPHISSVGRRLTQNPGRSGRPKIAQRRSGNSCTQGIPAGFPCGMPGMGDVMEGAIQHAPHWDRHSTPGREGDPAPVESFKSHPAGGVPGIAYSREILAIRPELPLVLTSGNLSGDPVTHGVQHAIRKPFDLEELASLLRKLLDEAAA